MGAVPSGRSVSERSPRSANVYISLCTTSEASPDVRSNSEVSSNPGVETRDQPYCVHCSSIVRITRHHRWSRGRTSCVPRGAWSLLLTRLGVAEGGAVVPPGVGGFAAGTPSLCAQICQERVARELDAECRLGA